MKTVFKILILAFFASCSSGSEAVVVNAEFKQSQDKGFHLFVVDTLISSFPVQIGNDRGTVEITSIKTFKNNKLNKSSFNISLKDISDYAVSRNLEANDLINSDEAVLFKDSTSTDFFMESALLKEVEFDFVRGNTLYFNATLENLTLGVEIVGRFNLFYRIKNKGEVYGLIIDEVNNLDSIDAGPD